MEELADLCRRWAEKEGLRYLDVFNGVVVESGRFIVYITHKAFSCRGVPYYGLAWESDDDELMIFDRKHAIYFQEKLKEKLEQK